jgi:hypothetical protein
MTRPFSAPFTFPYKTLGGRLLAAGITVMLCLPLIFFSEYRKGDGPYIYVTTFTFGLIFPYVRGKGVRVSTYCENHIVTSYCLFRQCIRAAKCTSLYTQKSCNVKICVVWGLAPLDEPLPVVT